MILRKGRGLAQRITKLADISAFAAKHDTGLRSFLRH